MIKCNICDCDLKQFSTIPQSIMDGSVTLSLCPICDKSLAQDNIICNTLLKEDNECYIISCNDCITKNKQRIKRLIKLEQLQ